MAKTIPALVSARLEGFRQEHVFWSFSSATRSEEIYEEWATAKQLFSKKVILSCIHGGDTDELTGLPKTGLPMTRHLNQNR